MKSNFVYAGNSERTPWFETLIKLLDPSHSDHRHLHYYPSYWAKL